MAEGPADGTRKRSRSPSDSEQPKVHKRANTGPTSTQQQNDSNGLDGTSSARVPTVSPASLNDVAMPDALSSTTNDTAASTPTATAPVKPEMLANADTPGSPTSLTAGASSSGAPPVPAADIHMRCLIVTQDASIIIGRGGKHVNEIRDKSGAKVMVSEAIPGNPERILNVNGPLDAVSKAFGLIVRRINDEPFDVPSVPGSRAVTIKFMIPNSRMGSIIGKGGAKIKEIQDASGARLNASEGMLPGSTERVLSVAGVADAIHIATYYIGNILIECQQRMPISTSNSSYRPSNRARPPPPPPPPAGGSSYVPGYGNNPYTPPAHFNPPQQQQTQQIFIPNSLVGSIIGKGGNKINEIRLRSQAHIKIMEPDAAPPASGGNENERMVTITGQPHSIQFAVQLLSQRLEMEKEKQQQMQTQPRGM